MDSVLKDNTTLYVDLDGTLVNTDIAQEQLIQSLKNFSQLLELGRQAFRGASYLKRYLSRNCHLSVENLPYNLELIEYLKTEKLKGRKIVLATAADKEVAVKISQHLSFFDDVIATTPGSNLKGHQKLEAIVDNNRGAEFEYIGDSSADNPIWSKATYCGYVNATNLITYDKYSNDCVSVEINNKSNALYYFLAAMRPHQWTKNFLIFVALFFSHSYFQLDAILGSIMTFVAFCLSASGVYMLNDLLDIEADRKHAKKRHRPFASGKLSPMVGIVASALLMLVSLALTLLFVNVLTFAVLIGYLCITNIYSFYVKFYSTIDVITLAGLYTVRIVAGASAIGVLMSPWLLNFSIFFFLSLAYIKRYVELADLGENDGYLSGRGYSKEDMSTVQIIGIVNGGLAVLTFALYLNSGFVLENYKTPYLLWLICPVLLFWICRVWMWANRGKIDSDPVVFAIKDRISIMSAVIIGAIFIASKFIDISGINP